MEKVSQTPHDAVFRQMLMHQAVAKDFLQLYLPAPFLAICELDSLQLVFGSFVEEDLRASYSDILYSLRTRHGPGYVYALIEHQSTPDKLMAFRLLRYALAAMQRHLDAGHDTLPLVVPILFYHGKVSPWPWARNWQQLFADPALAKALYSNDFPLVDLTVMPDNQIARHRRMAMLELLQKHIRHRDLAELQVPLIALMTQGYLTEAQLNTLLRYMLQAGTTEHPGALIRTLAASMVAVGAAGLVGLLASHWAEPWVERVIDLVRHGQPFAFGLTHTRFKIGHVFFHAQQRQFSLMAAYTTRSGFGLRYQ